MEEDEKKRCGDCDDEKVMVIRVFVELETPTSHQIFF